MLSRIFDFFGLIWPLIPFIACMVLLVLPKKRFPKRGVRGLVNYAIQLALPHYSIPNNRRTSTVMYRACAGVIALFCIGIFAIRDYSGFFPDHMRFVAYFDDRGIEHTLAHELTSNELEELRIPPDWQQRKVRYFDRLNRELQAQNVDFRADPREGSMHSSGNTFIKARRVSWGIQTYQISELRGDLTHTVKGPDDISRTITSRFELLPSPGQLVRATLYDIYIGHTIITKPMAQQTFRISPTREVTFDRLICLTKIRFFPYIDVGETIYFTIDSDEALVPIGFAVYFPT